MKRWLQALWACAIMLCSHADASNLPLIGTPPIARYVPELDVMPQNFAIVSDSQGLVFVGNTNGVIEFDGERWTLIPIDNRDIVRSLAVDAADRIYVGGYNAFGYLQRDAFGQARFVDLTQRFADQIGHAEFADIWDTLVTPEGVYFLALRDLFFWNPTDDSVRYWRHEGRFGAIAQTESGTLLQFRGEGFRLRQGDDFFAVPGTQGLTDLIYGLAPLSDGGYLCYGVDGAFRRLSASGQVELVSMPAGLPASSEFNKVVNLHDGSLVLASADGVLYIVDPLRRGMQRFKIDPGYLSSVHVTGGSGFLVSANQAIYRVSWPSEWTVLSEQHGAEGSIYGMSSWAGSEYLLSSAGASKLIPREGAPPRFESNAWSQGLASSLIEIDQHRALLAEGHGLTLVDHGQRFEVGVEPIYPRTFLKSRFKAGRIYVGTEDGLRIAQVQGRQVQLSAATASNQDVRVDEIVEISDQEVWVGTSRHGVWQLRLGSDGSIQEQRRYGPEQGLQLGPVAGASLAKLQDGRMLASTHQGFFRWHSDRFVPDDMDGLALQRHPEELLKLAQSPDGDLWAMGISRLFHQDGSGQWHKQAIDRLLSGAFNDAHFRADGSVVIVATQSLLLRNMKAPVETSAAPQVLLRSVVQTQSNGTRTPLPLAPEQAIHLAYADFSLRFQFALPDLTYPRGSVYQGRLLGYETEFSEWASARGYLYPRLSPGSYAMEVRARDGMGHLSTITPYRFIIDSPWYQQWWAYVMWVIISAMALLWLIATVSRYRTQKLAKQTRLLETMIAERTRDLAGANQQLELMVNLDGLTGIANRRKLDQFLAHTWSESRIHGQRMALLAIDVDHFKRYNDTHGHLAGDLYLKNLVQVLDQCLRHQHDLLARYGGEEFIVVIPGVDSATAALVAERMRHEVEKAKLGATISIGVASVIPGHDGVNGLIEAADTALYAAKNAGRNCVMIAAETSVQAV